jgi:hypothetical protein
MRKRGWIATVGAVVVAGCAALVWMRSSSDPAPADPCQVLTVQQIAEEVGVEVGPGANTTGEPDGAPGCIYPAGSSGGDVQIWLTRNDDLFDSLRQSGQVVATAANKTYTQRIDYQTPSEVAVSSRGDQFVIVYALGTSGAAARIADRAASKL